MKQVIVVIVIVILLAGSVEGLIILEHNRKHAERTMVVDVYYHAMQYEAQKVGGSTAKLAVLISKLYPGIDDVTRAMLLMRFQYESKETPNG